MIRRFLLAGAVGITLAVPVSSFGGDTVEVGIADYRFSPADLRIKPGTTVRWTNREKRTSHSILFLGPDGFESERLFPGDSYARTFDRPGRHDYSCGPHPEMKGSIDVAD